MSAKVSKLPSSDGVSHQRNMVNICTDTLVNVFLWLLDLETYWPLYAHTLKIVFIRYSIIQTTLLTFKTFFVAFLPNVICFNIFEVQKKSYECKQKSENDSLIFFFISKQNWPDELKLYETLFSQLFLPFYYHFHGFHYVKLSCVGKKHPSCQSSAPVL